jgi:UDP-glucose 4-epimerase
MRILVTGGAGYIGSHVVLALRDAGHFVVVVDNLSTGNRSVVPGDVTLIEGDVGDGDLTARAMEDHRIGAVMHFAGSLLIPESMRNPLEYYRNNTVASRALVDACVRKGVRNFVFSSTAAVYGLPATIPIKEGMPTLPISPYGTSKLMTEWILRDAAAAHDFGYVSLRYFNVAGADARGRSGQMSADATHLIDVACEAAVGRRGHIEVFGRDYDTPDGTCVRDYIHVSDLASAHVMALDHLAAGGASLVLNCGYGHGYSVMDVLSRVQRQANIPIEIRDASRRPGDPPMLIADAGKLRQTLAWRPQFDDLDLIVRTALDWERQHRAATVSAAAADHRRPGPAKARTG